MIGRDLGNSIRLNMGGVAAVEILIQNGDETICSRWQHSDATGLQRRVKNQYHAGCGHSWLPTEMGVRTRG